MKKKYLFLPLAIAVLAGAVFLVNKKGQELSQPVNFIEATQPVIMDNPELSKTPEEIATITEKALEDKTLPIKHSNSLIFTSQSPYAKWDDLHDEACEEASLIMAHNYLKETKEFSIREAEDEIQKMVTFQEGYFGSHKDLTAQEIIDLAWEYYEERYYLVQLTEEKPELFEKTALEKELNENSLEKEDEDAKIIENEEAIFSEKIEYMKEELSKGGIFIIPAAGRELENPYFRNPGPLYHALVIIGYDDNTQEFITHDPGTRRGENYRYPYKTLWNAIHDFPGKKSDILEGAKNIILIKKNND